MHANSPWPRLTGFIAATHTPFDEYGALNLAAIESQAEYLAGRKLTGVFIGGTTGESHSLTLDERLALTQRWMQVTKGSKLKVIVHVGANSQPDAIRLAADAQLHNAAGIAALAPSYFKPQNITQLLEFLAPIANAAPPLPFYYYDIPILSGVSLPMRELLERAPVVMPNFAGLKHTNMDLVQLQECLRFENGKFDVLWGFDEALLGALAFGCLGAVGSTYNFASALYHRVYDTFQERDFLTARAEQAKAVAMVRLLAKYGFHAACKAVMTYLGVPVGPVRAPLVNLSAEQHTALFNDLERTGMMTLLDRR